MKKILALLSATLILILCGCGPKENEYIATYLQTGYDPEVNYPVISVLHSVEERDACAAKAGQTNVTEALSEYDADFFSSHVVFVLNISMGSSAYRYVVEKVYETEDGLTFLLKQTTTGGVPAVVGGMTILVEMDQSWDCEVENIRIEYQ